MPDLFYPCCEVGDRVPETGRDTLKSLCWNCGDPDFVWVIDLDYNSGYVQYANFTYNARMVRPTHEKPPWRI